MKIGSQQIKTIVVTKHAISLYSLIADGQYRATSLGRNTWKSLIGCHASLQTNCNKEGFNVVPDQSAWSKARIGIIGNNENDCKTCDSSIGFGTGGFADDTCGNDYGNIKAMGYILVQWGMKLATEVKLTVTVLALKRKWEFIVIKLSGLKHQA